MDNSARVRHLTSRRPKEIQETLREIARDEVLPPSDGVVDAALALMGTADAEVRHDIVRALCLHWAHPRMIPMLRNMLEGHEQDLEVLIVSARSLGSLIERGGRQDKDSMAVLARVALDERRHPELRGVAYTGLRAAVGLLTDRERASLQEDILHMDVDGEWLRSMAGTRTKHS